MSFYGADINSAFSSFIPQPYEQQQQAPVVQQKQMSTPIEKLRAPQPPPQPQPQPIIVQQQQQLKPRREIIKIVTYSLVILFALSLYSVFEMIIKEISIGNDFGYKQELVMRFVYPVLIFIVIWNIKVFIQ